MSRLNSVHITSFVERPIFETKYLRVDFWIGKRNRFLDLFVKNINLEDYYLFIVAHNGSNEVIFAHLDARYHISDYIWYRAPIKAVNSVHPPEPRLEMFICKFNQKFVDDAEKTREE